MKTFFCCTCDVREIWFFFCSLVEEKKELLEFESKYFEIEKKSDQDLESDIRGLELEQKKLERLF